MQMSSSDLAAIGDALSQVLAFGFAGGVLASMVGYFIYDWLVGRFHHE